MSRSVPAIIALVATLGACASTTSDERADPRAEARAAVGREDLLTQMTFWAGEYQADPQDVEAARAFAAALRDGGRLERAAQVAEEALGRHPGDGLLARELGLALLALGDAGRAAQAFALYRNAAPEADDAAALLGVALDQSGRHRQAQEVYRMALERAPQNAALLTNLGVSHLLAGDLEEARTVLEQATLAPDAPPHARQNLALTLGLLGRFDEAQRLARVDLSPELAANNIAYLRALRGDERRWSDLEPPPRR